ncbi:MAG: response regulator [Candidatus Hydrogenedentota bacterium]|nr:MAG: response regulator [Candidatus Hydrogenedentota bacterium]
MKEEATESRLILLVEDDENDVRLIQRALRKGDVPNPIEVVRDGERALDYLFAQGEYADRDRYPLPSLVLLDLKLPKYSGHEVLERIKGEPVLRRLPVVVLTSSTESADINRAYDLGANSYLVKPVRLDDLEKLAQATHLYWLLLNQSPTPCE